MNCKKLSILFLFSTFLATAHAQTSIPPTHGTGTQTDPYQIASLENLCWLSQLDYYWGTYFEQTTDIDASATITWNDGKGFYPIGDDYRFFDGHYDGKGHIIRNLYIKQSTLFGTGFFGNTFFASVKNLGLINCTVSGTYNSGGIIGNAGATTIANCFITGAVSGNDNTGGIAGNSHDVTITNCYSNATITGQNYTGGLIGNNFDSEISYCYASGNISGTFAVGGLTGSNSMYSTISNCYATGNTAGTDFIGGLAGRNEMNSTINNCYTTANINGNQYTGGFVGSNEMYSTINNCYSSGKVTAQFPNYSGGFVGFNIFSSSINESYWNTDMSGQTSGVGSNEIESTCSIFGLNSVVMKSQAAFAEWDFNSTWGILENSSYPALKNLNNAPFGYPDTICTRNTLALRNLLLNDYDYETSRDSLVIRICNLSAGNYLDDSLYISEDVNFGDTIIIEYQPGELYQEIPDTLWGNKVRSMFIYGNNAPAVVSAVNISIPEDSKHVFTWNDISAIDADRDDLAIIIAPGEHYTFNSDTLIPEPDYYGILTVNLTVADGLDTSLARPVQVDVIEVNDAPVVYDLSGMMLENDTITIEVTASDKDGTVRSIVIGHDPLHGTAKHSGMTITYIPYKDFTGKDTIIWYAIDNNNILSIEAKFIITVNMQNHAPEITSQAPTTAIPGEHYVYTVTASDLNQDSLIYNLLNAPEGMTISAEGLITWTPGEDITASGDVILQVSDGELEDTETFNITVTGLSPNEEADRPTMILYPNPCKNGFYIETGSEKTSMLYMFDMDGRMVLTQPAMGVSWIDISHLKAGSYIVSIHSVRLHLIKN